MADNELGDVGADLGNRATRRRSERDLIAILKGKNKSTHTGLPWWKLPEGSPERERRRLAWLKNYERIRRNEAIWNKVPE